jgi:hypothetical protein
MLTQEDEHIERKYEKAFSRVGSIQTVFPASAKFEMQQIVERIVKTDANIKKYLSTKQTTEVKAGLIFEELIAESRSLDAMVKEKSLASVTDKFKGDFNSIGLKSNDQSIDIADINTQTGKMTGSIQAKTGTDSAATVQNILFKTKRVNGKDIAIFNVHSETGKFKYEDVDAILVPSNQIADIREKLIRIAEKNRTSNPELAKAAEVSAKKVKAVHDNDGVYGKGQTSDDLMNIAEGNKEGEDVRKNNYSGYQTKSTLKNMGKAATGAAAMSAITSGVYNTFTYLKMAKEGKITEDEAVIKIIGETVSSSVDSAVKAAANTGVQSMLVRYGSKKVVEQVAKQGLKNMVKTNAISIAVFCGIDMVKDLVKLSAGKITQEQFEERNGKNILNTSAGALGSSLGAAIAPSLGLGPLAPAVIGSLICGMAMTFAIENGVEKPYRELVENTVAIRESMQVLQEVSYNIFNGQVVFTAFLKKERALNVEIENQMERVSQAGKKMSRAIDRL